jgi:putative resolvase
MEKLITVTEAALQLGVTKRTLQDWDRSGKLSALRTAGGHRRYRQSDIEKLQGIETEESNRNSVCVYCRVSSQDQKQKEAE